MKRIGILSDTHGTFDEPLREFLREVDEVWHAGDIGSLEVADRIAAFKPLRAVSGNPCIRSSSYAGTRTSSRSSTIPCTGC